LPERVVVEQLLFARRRFIWLRIYYAHRRQLTIVALSDTLVLVTNFPIISIGTYSEETAKQLKLGLSI